MPISKFRNATNCVAFLAPKLMWDRVCLHTCLYQKAKRTAAVSFHQKILFIFKNTGLHIKILQLK